MIKLKNVKNSFLNIKAKFTHKITEEEALERYMIQLIEEAEEDLKNGGRTITLEEWRKELIKEYNVSL